MSKRSNPPVVVEQAVYSPSKKSCMETQENILHNKDDSTKVPLKGDAMEVEKLVVPTPSPQSLQDADLQQASPQDGLVDSKAESAAPSGVLQSSCGGVKEEPMISDQTENRMAMEGNGKDDASGEKVPNNKDDVSTKDETQEEKRIAIVDQVKGKLRTLISKITRKDVYGIFHTPVDLKEHPTYLDIISHPMDLAALKTNLSSNKYQWVEEFMADLDLMWNNCLLYNSSDEFWVQYCINTREFAQKHLSKVIECELKKREKEKKKKEQENLARAASDEVYNEYMKSVNTDKSKDYRARGPVLNGKVSNKSYEASKKEITFRKYVLTNQYIPVVDEDIVRKKLSTTITGHCDGAHCDDMTLLGPFNLFTGSFSKAKNSDRAHNVECSDKCACNAQTCLNRAISIGKAKRFNVASSIAVKQDISVYPEGYDDQPFDVEECITYGFDPYTRRNIYMSVPEKVVLHKGGPLVSVGAEERDRFIQNVLCPALIRYSARSGTDVIPHVIPPWKLAKGVTDPVLTTIPPAKTSRKSSANASTCSTSTSSSRSSSRSQTSGEAESLPTQDMGTSAVPNTQSDMEVSASIGAAPSLPAAAAAATTTMECEAKEKIEGQQEGEDASARKRKKSLKQQEADAQSGSGTSKSGGNRTKNMCSMLKAAHCIITDAIAADDRLTAVMAWYLVKDINRFGEKEFRVLNKGYGMICCAKDGFKKNEFVGEYCGEVFPPWRWFEKQDAVKNYYKQRKMPMLPEFYNIQLERPVNDEMGYDLLYVEPILKGNFVSRFSHSCNPNCATVLFKAGGRLVIGMFAIRDVQFGEEMTFDYNSVTESAEEYKNAVCLCADKCCRGSFLYYGGSDTFQQVISEKHTFLDRTALLLRACSGKASDGDRQLCAKFGFKKSILSDLPEWGIKFAAEVLKYVELEKEAMPKELSKWNDLHQMGEWEAQDMDDEIQGIVQQRLQNLAIALDKVKYVLRASPGDNTQAEPPLRMISEAEAVDLLWNSQNSVFSDLLTSLEPHANKDEKENFYKLLELAKVKVKVQPKDSSSVGVPTTGAVYGMDHVRRLFLQVRDILRQMKPNDRAYYHAAADIAHLRAHTKHYFAAHTYVRQMGEPVSLEDHMPPTPPGKPAGKAPVVDGKKYGPQYIWGLLSYWMKQTIEMPDASLSANKRGTISIPAFSSCFTTGRAALDPKRRYTNTFRTQMMNHLKQRPWIEWTTKWHFKFANKQKIYGSPNLDSIIERNPNIILQVVEEMEKWKPNLKGCW